MRAGRRLALLPVSTRRYIQARFRGVSMAGCWNQSASRAWMASLVLHTTAGFAAIVALLWPRPPVGIRRYPSDRYSGDGHQPRAARFAVQHSET